jgi:hypothetical protein
MAYAFVIPELLFYKQIPNDIYKFIKVMHMAILYGIVTHQTQAART